MTVGDKYVKDKIDELIRQDAIVIDEIARNANKNQMTLYKYFISLHELIFEEMERLYKDG